MNELSPIILFVYNRPDHTKQTVESLLQCKFAKESVLYIFSDAPKTEEQKSKVDQVRKYIHSINGFKEIIIEESSINKGLANSVIYGVSKILNDYNSVIVLEDDLVFSSNFLEFMNEALRKFKDDKNIYTISGYSFPVQILKGYDKDVYLSYRSSSWGWGTWKDKWEKAEWENSIFYEILNNKKLQNKFNRAGNDYSPMLIKQLKGVIDSWAIKWAYIQMKNEAYTLFPVKSLVRNIGLDGSGTHSKKRKRYVVKLEDFNPNLSFSEQLEINDNINDKIRKLNSLSIYRRLRNFISYGIF
jgi:hypothetical protein